MSEIYISCDIESDGPIPGPNSMLSFGAAAFQNKKMVSTFEANLHLLEGASGDPKTMEWWKTQPEAWTAARTNLQKPEHAMKNFVAWVNSFNASPVFVGYPAGFDFLFIYWYLIKFTGVSPFSFSALDIKTYACAKLQIPYRKATKKSFPKNWFTPGLPHTHKALDDAIEQGHIFINMFHE